MAKVSETVGLVDGIVRLRRAERVPEVTDDVAPVRRALEREVGPTFSRARAARVLGVSQTALDRWIDNGQVPVVIGPAGRKEVPRQVVIELREAIDRLRGRGITRHQLAAALAQRRDASAGSLTLTTAGAAAVPRGHDTADRRSLAYHRAVADRLDDGLVADARDRVDRLEAEGHLDAKYGAAWRELLGQPFAQVREALVQDTQTARDLRQNSPFAGVLNEHERRHIIETVR
jgi:hypothetical protein